ncbi:hypothetical protein AKJ09_08798 [Labilithrix luteola]|uniref:Uncharacterized protein n=1 Tax=Labilithrix luteola TaxID=1391654 RepID=A0A0K1Q9P4_9BACT|nr:hypothetical protein AKJ09_08798 [Labilithrix luteola]
MVATSTALLACSTSEGERCNISLSHDECGSGLSCAMPDNCHYAVCCPPAGRASSSSACSACEPETPEVGPSSETADADASVQDAATDAPDSTARDTGASP